MSEWQEAMVWTSIESVGMVDGSATLSWCFFFFVINHESLTFPDKDKDREKKVGMVDGSATLSQ